MRKATILARSLAIAVATASLTPAAFADEPLRIGKSIVGIFAFNPVDVGVKEGIFKKHGLDVDIIAFGGAPKLHQALTADAVDVGLGGGPEMAFIVKGEPVKAVAALAGPPLEVTITIRPDASITTIADLKGKKISISQVGSLSGWLLAEVSRRQGWGVDGIQPVPMGSPSASWAAMETKQSMAW